MQHTFNPSSREAEEVGLGDQGQSGLQSEFQNSRSYTADTVSKKEGGVGEGKQRWQWKQLETRQDHILLSLHSAQVKMPSKHT